ncbi:MAG TPA: DUF4097 family beta strand repeat-containing protein [Trebonia sp.]
MTTISPGAPPSAPRQPGGGTPRGRLTITPARRAAIVIGVPIVFLIFITNGFSAVTAVSQGSFPVSGTVPLPAGKLTMNFGGGGGTLRGSDVPSAMARVAGTVMYRIWRPTLRLAAGDISLDCPVVDEGNCSLNATIDVPARTTLAVTTGGGDLSASGLADGATLDTDGGNLTVTGAAGDLVLASGGGDVSADRVSGPVVSISASGGNIGGSAVSAATVTADSGGGDVTLTFTTIPRNLQVNADGGNITIVVPHGSYAVIANADGGNLANSIPAAKGALNAITVSSGGGDISLSESPSN